MTAGNVAIVLPYFNENQALAVVLSEIVEVVKSLANNTRIMVVDDGSSDPPKIPPALTRDGRVEVEVLTLQSNLGHQAAIARGLKRVSQWDFGFEFVIVMDSDGEDSPHAIPALLAEARSSQISVVAQRKRRQENLSFRLGYWAFRLMSKTLVGIDPNFGNFMVIRREDLKVLLSTKSLGLHLPATLLLSDVRFLRLGVDRGKRYFGESKMRFHALVIHGLVGMNLHRERLIVRLLVLASVSSAGLVFLSLALASLRLLFPSLTVPGWTSQMIAFAGILSVQVWVAWLVMSQLLVKDKLDYQVNASD